MQHALSFLFWVAVFGTTGLVQTFLLFAIIQGLQEKPIKKGFLAICITAFLILGFFYIWWIFGG